MDYNVILCMGVPHVTSTDLWLLHVSQDLTCQNSVFCLYSIFMCFTLTYEQMATIFWYNNNSGNGVCLQHGMN